MLNDEELEFFSNNKERILDLIRAVDKHEMIRAIIGPGQVHNHPHVLPDYTRSHDVMSRLSNYLHGAARLGLNNIGPLDDHADIPARVGWDPAVGVSC